MKSVLLAYLAELTGQLSVYVCVSVRRLTIAM